MYKEIMRKLDEFDYRYWDMDIEKVIMNEQKNNIIEMELLPRGFGNLERKPRPRYYSENALSEMQYFVLGVESRFGHIWKATESEIPIGKIIASKIEDGILNGLLYVNPKEDNIIEKLVSGIIEGVSIDADVKRSVTTMVVNGKNMRVDFINSITRVNSVDLVNKDKKGTEARVLGVFSLN